MHAFDLPTLAGEMSEAGQPWSEFLRVPALSMGVYRLVAGDVNRQRPHTEDEVYYVVSGRATFRCGQQSVPARPGTILFVEREADHRFTDVVEELTLLVFFAPAEHSLEQAGSSQQ
jgi:mannose-6-phosphate isomerase-like protein (cupin superfamily)